MAYAINININGDMIGGGTADGSAAANIGAPKKGGTTDISHLSKYIAAQTIQPFISKTKDFVISSNATKSKFRNGRCSTWFRSI